MTTLMERAAPADFWPDDELDPAGDAPVSHLTPSLQGAPGSTWVWCFRCERAFQLADLSAEDASASCAYADCQGGALDFWRWEAYRAFVGNAPTPARGVRFGLAQ